MERMTGYVKWFNAVRGYGFLYCNERKKDIFVHFSAIQTDGYKKLEPDQQVEFQIVHTPKGDQAEDVVVKG